MFRFILNSHIEKIQLCGGDRTAKSSEGQLHVRWRPLVAIFGTSYWCSSFVSCHYRPQRSWGKAIFSQACVILFTGGFGGTCMVAGGHAWLLGSMHGCWGACMVAGRHAWLLGGMHGCWGACMVVGGMHGCWGACVADGACVVPGRCAWLLGEHAWPRGHTWQGGMYGKGGCVVKGGMCGKGGHAWQRGGMHGI